LNLEPIGAVVFDYADLLLRARRNLKEFEIAMNNRHFGEAHEYMMNAFVDVRLLTHISGELDGNTNNG
jgi:hypothetical protein